LKILLAAKLDCNNFRQLRDREEVRNVECRKRHITKYNTTNQNIEKKMTTS